MIINYNSFNTAETPVLSLCNPSSKAQIDNGSITLSDTIGMLPDCKNLSISANFNALWEMSFDFSDLPNPRIHYIYNNLQKGRYIYVSNIGYFIIDSISEKTSQSSACKTISCHSAEAELKRCPAPLLDEGVYYFYSTEEKQGIIQKVMELCPKWRIAFVDEALKEKTAYFGSESNSENAYDFMWDELETAYECVIDADFIKKTLSFYSLEYYAAHHMTDISLLYSNDLKQLTAEATEDDLFTAISVTGDKKISITYANPAGSETLYNFDNCINFMPEELRSAVLKWQEKYNLCVLPFQGLNANYVTALDSINRLYQDLEILEDEYNMLKSQRDAIINSNVKDSDKRASLLSVNSSLKQKQNQINSKKSSINTAEKSLDKTFKIPIQNYINECSISLTAKDKNGNPIFTKELLEELSAYIKTADYSDEYITSTDDMSYSEVYDLSVKLFEKSRNQLNKLSSGLVTFSVESNSFLFSKKFARFANQLCPGAIIWVETAPDVMQQLHLTNFTADYEQKNVSMTFGNKYNKNDLKSLFDDVFGNVKSSANQIKYLKNVINDQQSLINKQKHWIDNALILTKDHALTTNNQTITIDDSGYWGRRRSTDEDGNLIFDDSNNPIFDNEQIKIINNGVYISSDNWQTLATAIGKIYLYHDDTTGEDVYKYGVAGDVIIGKLLLGKELNLVGGAKSNGTYAITMNEKGITIINDGSAAGLTIKDSNGNKQFYADSKGNLCISAKITADEGRIGGWEINSYKIFAGGKDGVKTAVMQVPGKEPYYVFAAGGSNHNDYGDCPFRVSKYGELFAEKGNIAGWKVNNNDMYKEVTENGVTYKTTIRAGSHAETAAFFVEKNGELQFYVTYGGYLKAINANISGTITAKNGSIGGWTITGSKIHSNNGNTYVASSGEYAFYSSGKNGTFKVGFYGDLYCDNATIKGKITATSGSFTGTINATSGSFKGTIKGDAVLADGVILGTNGGCKIYAYNSGYGLTGCIIKHGDDGGYIKIAQTYGGEQIFLESTYINLKAKDAGYGWLAGHWSSEFSINTTSDRRLKNSIAKLTDNYSVLFDNLKPCVFKYNNENSGRKHIGFIAQDVEDAIQESGLTSYDAALVTDFANNDDVVIKTLCYEEIIGMLVHEVQTLKRTINPLT